MNKAYFLLFAAPAALVWACGGDSSTSDGGSDATTDTMVSDAAKDSSTSDGSSDGGKDGSTDASQDLNITITCMKPADCFDGGDPDAAYPPDSGEVCCGTVQTSGNFPSCNFGAAGTACAAPSACPTALDLQACGTDTVRLCASNAECTEQGGQFTTFTTCCSTQYQDAGRIHFCANTSVASISQGIITCP